MNPPVFVNLAIMVAAASCLTWPAVVQAYNMNRYGKQQLAQKQYRYGNPPSWLGGANRAGGWTSPYGMMRHYPVSANRYQEVGNRQMLSDDYYDPDMVTSPYDRQRPYDQLDYAVVRYPSYGMDVGDDGGYYNVADLAAYDDPSNDDDGDDDAYYENSGFAGIRDPASSYYHPSAVHRHASPSNRYDSARYPTDKIHKFRKVFMSNLVSPSNAFKSSKEQQLYNFWESLVNGDLGRMRPMDDNDDDDGRRQQWADGHDRPSPESSDANAGASKLYQHLPLIFQQLQKQQKQMQQQRHPQQQPQQQPQSQQEQQLQKQLQLSVDEWTSVPSSSSVMPQTVPHGNLYKQWANGSPLIKRSSDRSQYVETPLITPADNDDVRQLEKLKTADTTKTTAEPIAVTTSTTTATVADATVPVKAKAAAVAVPMADGGQREYVLPRPAGEKSSFESLLEVIAEGGLRGNSDKNAAVAYNKLRQEAKMNQKRSYVSDETSLAAQLGALRKN